MNSNAARLNYLILLISRLHQSTAQYIHSLGFDERFYHVCKRFLFIHVLKRFKLFFIFKRFLHVWCTISLAVSRSKSSYMDGYFLAFLSFLIFVLFFFFYVSE